MFSLRVMVTAAAVLTLTSCGHHSAASTLRSPAAPPAPVKTTNVKRRALPRHDCHYADAGAVATASLTVAVISARGTSCHEAKRVFRATSRWLDPGDYQHLGALRHPSTLGYRCRVYLIGDSYWHLRCQRGSRLLYGDTAQ